MATVAIDFGARRTQLAQYSRSRRQVVVYAEVPTVAYIPPSAPILVCDRAIEAIAADPVGGIDDLKARFDGDDYVRNRRLVAPSELLSLVLSEARRLTLERDGCDDPLTHCVLTVPAYFNTRQRDLLQNAARKSGFATTSLMEDADAAARTLERERPADAQVLVVCDLGCETRITTLRRDNGAWHSDPSLPYLRAVESVQNQVPQSLLSDLQSVSSDLSQRGIADASLLLVGGGTRSRTSSSESSGIAGPARSSCRRIPNRQLLRAPWIFPPLRTRRPRPSVARVARLGWHGLH